jgi:hypothetical protein
VRRSRASTQRELEMRGFSVPRQRVASEFLPNAATKEGLAVTGSAGEDNRNRIRIRLIEASENSLLKGMLKHNRADAETLGTTTKVLIE